MMLTNPFLQRFLEIFLDTFLSRAKKTALRQLLEEAHLLFLDCLEKFGTTLKIFLGKTTNVICGRGLYFSAFTLGV